MALDLGLGLANQPIDADRSITGFGLNLEIAFGISHELELGLRTGTRIGGDGEATRADRYGRTSDTETPRSPTAGRAGQSRGAPALGRRPGSTLQLGWRDPFISRSRARTRAGVMFGVPLRLRLGAARVDTGIYVPMRLSDPTVRAPSASFHLWIQAGPALWLGPLLGVRIVNQGGASHSVYPLGFGLGLALTRAIDLRTWCLFPNISGEAARAPVRRGRGLADPLR